MASESAPRIFPLVRLLDAPVDHVPERRELVDLLLELRELVGVRVRREGVAHGAGHPGLGELRPQLLFRGGVAVEEQIADLDLLHEDVLERLELLGRVLGLVGRDRCRPRRGRSPARRANDHRIDPSFFMALPPDRHADGVQAMISTVVSATACRQSGDSGSGCTLSPVPESTWVWPKTSFRHIMY